MESMCPKGLWEGRQTNCRFDVLWRGRRCSPAQLTPDPRLTPVAALFKGSGEKAGLRLSGSSHAGSVVQVAPSQGLRWKWRR